jgi:hypothetical protein
MVVLTDFEFQEGTPVVGGIWAICIAKRSEVASITNGVITMKAGKRFYKVYVSDDKNLLEADKASEEADNTGFIRKISFACPTLSKELSSFAEATISGEFIILAREGGECEVADWQIIGDTCKGARMTKASFKSGQATGDMKGAQFTFTHNGTSKPLQICENSDVLALVGIPSPPVIGANAITATGFNVNWAVVAGAVGYRLDVSTSNTFATFVVGFENLAIAGGSTTLRAVTGLTTATTYYYRLRSVDADGEVSSNSAVNSATTA